MQDMRQQSLKDCERLTEQLSKVVTNALEISQWGYLGDSFSDYLVEIANQAEKAREVVYRALGR